MKIEYGLNFKITGESSDPSQLDYDIMGYHKKRTIIKGELTKVEYYKNFDGVNYSDLIVEETRQYTRNEIGLALYRTQNSKWYLENNTVGLEKTFIKYYTMNEMLSETMTRSTNIINEAKIYLLNNIGYSNGQNFMQSVGNEITLFINGTGQPLRDAVTNSTKEYMTIEIKNAVVEILTFV